MGPEERRRSGQAVVHFAAKSDGVGWEQVAIKLFSKKQGYDKEAEVYKSSPPRFFMPTVLK